MILALSRKLLAKGVKRGKIISSKGGMTYNERITLIEIRRT